MSSVPLISRLHTQSSTNSLSLWVNVCCDIVNIQSEQQWSKNGALRDTWQNGCLIWFYSIYYSLLPETQKKNLSISASFHQYHNHIACIKVVHDGCIKSFLESQDKCVNLSAIIQDFSPIVYNSDQLSFTTVPLSECMLSIWQTFMFVQMCHDIRAYYVFKQLARYTCYGDGTVNASQRPISFFKKWAYIC